LSKIKALFRGKSQDRKTVYDLTIQSISPGASQKFETLEELTVWKSAFSVKQVGCFFLKP